jgi:hypothetical protein
LKGRASIAFQFERLVVDGESQPIRTARIARHHRGVAGGGKGAVIGGAVGGTGAVLATKGKEVRLPAGTVVTTRVRDSVTVRVPIPKEGTERR